MTCSDPVRRDFWTTPKQRQREKQIAARENLRKNGSTPSAAPSGSSSSESSGRTSPATLNRLGILSVVIPSFVGNSMPSSPPSSKGASSPTRKIPRGSSHLEAAFARSIRALKLPEPVREYRFDPVRKWRFDFAWPDQKVAVEIEGGIWRPSGKGAHTGGTAVTRDAEKSNAAQLAGWLVLRFVAAHLKDGSAVELTARALGQGAGAEKIDAQAPHSLTTPRAGFVPRTGILGEDDEPLHFHFP